jgi:hypothetical protein
MEYRCSILPESDLGYHLYFCREGGSVKNLIKLGELLWINVNDPSRGIIFMVKEGSEHTSTTR